MNKIRTTNDLQDAIAGEMSWRKKELSILKADIKVADNFEKNILLKSGIILLYSHWEGAIKNIATFYLEFVYEQKLPYSDLKINFIANSIKKDLNTFSETNKSTKHVEVLKTFISKNTEISCPLRNKVVETKGNLNSAVFKEVLTLIGFDEEKYESEYEASYTLIDHSLLMMRNKIAHGERIQALSLDEKRYFEIHKAILSLIVKFSEQVFEAANKFEYRRKN